MLVRSSKLKQYFVLPLSNFDYVDLSMVW